MAVAVEVPGIGHEVGEAGYEKVSVDLGVDLHLHRLNFATALTLTESYLLLHPRGNDMIIVGLNI